MKSSVLLYLYIIVENIRSLRITFMSNKHRTFIHTNLRQD